MEIRNGELPNVGWVSEDGSYGWSRLVVFDPDLLTRHQWQVLDDLADSDKQAYVKAIIAGENLDEWESQ